MIRRNRPAFALLLTIIALIIAAQPAAAQSTSTFTYQGYLTRSSDPVTGTCDFQFSLFGLASGGSQIGTTQTRTGVSVAQGVFSVQLDFGAGSFNGVPRYLQIAAKCGAEVSYTALSPRQALTVAPYALTAFQALSATTAINMNWNGLTGTPTAWLLNGNAATNPATQFIGTTDDQPLEVRVNSQRAMRFESNAGTIFGSAPNVIGGSVGNVVNANVYGATISGGGGNMDTTARNVVGGNGGTIGGGFGNTVTGLYATIAGGINGNSTGPASTVGGGVGNTATNEYDTVGGGNSNTARGGYSTVGGGIGNNANGLASTVSGGANNSANGNYAFAAGRRAKAVDTGSFVWADSQDVDVNSAAANTFTVRASGGIWLGTNSSPSIGTNRFLNTSTGGYLTTGGVWVNSSDRALKANFTQIDPRAVLEAVAAMPISAWNYTAEGDAIKHLGPTAQDFRAAFGLGQDDKSISTVDAAGVALAAIQALKQENDALKLRVAIVESATSNGLVLPALIVAVAMLGAALIVRRR